MYIHPSEFSTDDEIRQLKSTIAFLVSVLSSIAEYRNFESGEHVQRIQEYTGIMIHHLLGTYPEYGLNHSDIELIIQASALHDIGKIAVADNILMKPSKLTREEFSEMKRHTIYGCEILQNFVKEKNLFFQYSYDICRYHHERWDGNGYPDGLKGDRIPIWAQVVSIADVYDALVNKKVYKGAFDRNKAEQMIINGNCGVFNPKIIDCFKQSLNEFAHVKNTP